MFSMNEYINRVEKANQERKDFLKLSFEKIQKIKKAASRIINYPEYHEAYEYVDNLFPNVGVKDVTIYKATAAIFEKYGFGCAQGFYNTQTKNIFISSIKPVDQTIPRFMRIQGKMEPDEVIVHEIIHYCYFENNLYSNSRDLNEEFAYGWSLEYLRSKGYTDDQIIKYNFFPYLFETVYQEAYKDVLLTIGTTIQEYRNLSENSKNRIHDRIIKKVITKAKAMALSKGHRLIKIYSKLHAEGSPFKAKKDGSNRFDLLDI